MPDSRTTALITERIRRMRVSSRQASVASTRTRDRSGAGAGPGHQLARSTQLASNLAAQLAAHDSMRPRTIQRDQAARSESTSIAITAFKWHVAPLRGAAVSARGRAPGVR